MVNWEMTPWVSRAGELVLRVCWRVGCPFPSFLPARLARATLTHNSSNFVLSLKLLLMVNWEVMPWVIRIGDAIGNQDRRASLAGVLVGGGGRGGGGGGDGGGAVEGYGGEVKGDRLTGEGLSLMLVA